MDHPNLPVQLVTPGLVLVSRSDFCRFYDTYAPRLYGHLLRQGHPVETAQQLLAQTFSRCWQERDQLQRDPPALNASSPLSWLLRVAQQVATLPPATPGEMNLQAPTGTG